MLSQWLQGAAPRRLWAVSLLVLAPGCFRRPSYRVATLLVAAVCVGGTFMVATMAGMQEHGPAGARRPG